MSSFPSGSLPFFALHTHIYTYTYTHTPEYPTSSQHTTNSHQGTNLNGVKIKVSRFRVEQRKLFDEYGWTLPDGGAVLKKTPTPRKNKKRDAEEEVGEGDDVDEDTPKAKKPRGRKAKAKKEACVEAEVEEEDSGKVKDEVLDEDM